MASPSLELFAIDHYVSLEELGRVLKFGEDQPLTELSVNGWEDKETVMDELATFFPFPRYFSREWEAVKDYVADLVSRGRLITLRGVPAQAGGAAFDNVVAFIDDLASLYGTPQAPQGRVVVVLEGYAAPTLQGKKNQFNVTRFQLSATQGPALYNVQVSAKRNHTYYVNLCLKVFQRREWYTQLELSGLGNAIPSIVSITEILKRYKVATVKKIETSLVELSDVEGSRPLPKAKIVVILDKIASIPDIPEDAGDQVI
jgi:hypothetical protein